MEKSTLYTKLNKIRLELSKSMQKSGNNTYSNYTYFQLKDFMPEAIKLCNENKIFTKFWVSKDKQELPGKKTTNYVADEKGVQVASSVVEEENFTYVELAHLLVKDLESGEEELFVKETADCKLQAAQPIQNLGSKSTYMKRYMYIDLFEIIENDQIEEETGKPVEVETKVVKKTTKKPVVETVSTKPEPVVEKKDTPAPAEAPVVNTDDLMTMETKMELANYIKGKGLDPRTTILEIANELGVDVPQLKESQKEEIIKKIDERN